MVSFEAKPIIKVGGLGEVPPNILSAMAKTGIEATIVMPSHGSVKRRIGLIEETCRGMLSVELKIESEAVRPGDTLELTLKSESELKLTLNLSINGDIEPQTMSVTLRPGGEEKAEIKFKPKKGVREAKVVAEAYAGSFQIARTEGRVRVKSVSLYLTILAAALLLVAYTALKIRREWS